MKSKFFITLISCSLFLFLICKNAFSDEIIINSTNIKILDKGDIVSGNDGVEVITNSGLEITADNSIYYKKKSFVEINENIIAKDKINKIDIFANKATYNKIEDVLKITGDTKIILDKDYTIDTADITYDKKNLKIFSNKKTIIIDRFENNIESNSFELEINKGLLKLNELVLIDIDKNKLNLVAGVLNTKTKELIGKDLSIDFNNSLFGNEKNRPRLKGKSIVSNNNEKTIYKGAFTTCNNDENKCPAWSIYADEVTHKKKQQSIEYKNAWLKIYDKPVLYFPYFFHPDPTVNRKSGFLMPKFINSKNYGTSFQIPYYKVISDNKDLTIFPRLYFDDKFLIQNEYRQANKESDLNLDFSFNKNNDDFDTHFFSNLKGFNDKKKIDYEINIEQTSNDDYLRVEKLESPLIDDPNLLNSHININKTTEDYSFESSIEVFEDLRKEESKRYEYIYPNYEFIKNLNSSYSGNLKFISKGFNKSYNDNTDETLIVNDIKFESYPFYSPGGFSNSYELILKNVNYDSSNSLNYKSGTNYELLSGASYTSKYPLRKELENSINFLSPIFSARFSPNKTKNIKDKNKKLTYNNVYSFNRLNQDDMIEGGASISYGLEYSKRNLNYNEFLNVNIANVIRDKANQDLPEKMSLNKSVSDWVGEITFNPSEKLSLQNKFSLDKDLDESNYNLFRADLNLNNFITSFEFLEEDNFIGDQSYLSNKTTLLFNENNSLSFKNNRNLDKNINEYYNLIYEYKNDCLIAALEYNKDYYSDNNLKPETSLFFSIKIVPFGNLTNQAQK